ncbi:DUF2971 domain-containing protein [candidate division KSB1 bacterium]|nr:DUF2971 domain-containing protein [candidate division KSB1 bacterium]
MENLHFVIDIIFNKRLFCCYSNQLNDIREADVRVGKDQGREVEIFEFGNEVTKRLRELRVCSLSKSFNNHLLWAHYAGGYTGVAIEVELEDRDVTDVSYDDNFIFLSDFIAKGSAEDAARQVLTKKYKAWSYEEEVRLITKTEFYPLAYPISRVIVGSRTNPALVSALHLMCSHFGITLDRMVIADWGIYTVGAQPLHL